MMKQSNTTKYMDTKPNLWGKRNYHFVPSNCDLDYGKMGISIPKYCTNCNECKNNNDKEK